MKDDNFIPALLSIIIVTIIFFLIVIGVAVYSYITIITASRRRPTDRVGLGWYGTFSLDVVN